MVAPACDQQVADVFLGEPVGFVAYNPRRRLAGAGDHGKRSGDFPVPACEGMQPRPSVAETIAIVAARDDVHQPAGWAAVGVVIDGEQTAEGVEAARVRIPET